MLINAQGSRLASLRPGDTTAATVFTASINTEITNFIVCNVGGMASRDFRLFHAESGGSFDEDTALFWDKAVAQDDVFNWQSQGPNAGITLMAGDLIGFRSDTADELVIHLYGVTQSIAPQS